MSTIVTCLACGHESRDVEMRLIEVPGLEDQRVVQSAIPTAEDQRGVKGFEYVDVRERYISEPRCRDAKACDERVAAIAAPQEPAALPVEDDAWLL